jgi:hypothetical protein
MCELLVDPLETPDQSPVVHWGGGGRRFYICMYMHIYIYVYSETVSQKKGPDVRDTKYFCVPSPTLTVRE